MIGLIGRELYPGFVRRDVAAVVLTHRRPRLASRVVRDLLDIEGIPPESLLLVVNGEGGVDDPSLESRVQILRLPANGGPAGGWAAGFDEALRRFPQAGWIYACEDDVSLFGLPAPRIERVLSSVERMDGDHRPVGAVVAFGRCLDPRTGLSKPALSFGAELEHVDVAAWGASLISRALLETGVRPDPGFFFGYEDFDFFLAASAAGFAIVADREATAATVDSVTDKGRQRAFARERPDDTAEPWRSYYQARNFLELRRRHGRRLWTVVHLLKSIRRAHRAGAGAGLAILRGLFDGFRRRIGQNPRYIRTIGELPSNSESRDSSSGQQTDGHR